MLNILGRKKDHQAAYVASERLDGKYVKRTDDRRERGIQPTHHSSANIHHNPRGIQDIDIPDTYFDKEASLVHLPDPSLGNKIKKRLPLFARKKKTPSESNKKAADDNGYDDDISDAIVAYNDLVPDESTGLDQRKLNPVVLSQLATLKLHNKQFAQNDYVSDRLQYIIHNYRQPPAYPGHTSIDSRPSILQQLLQEQASLHLKDNASMINYIQVDLPSGLSNEDLTKIIKTIPDESGSEIMDGRVSSENTKAYRDRLVLRTHEPPSHAQVNKGVISSTQLFEQRQKYYNEQYQKRSVNSDYRMPSNERHIAEALSEFYPRDYDVQGPITDYAIGSGNFPSNLDLPSYSDDKGSYIESVDSMNQGYIPHLEDEQSVSQDFLQRRPSQTYVPPSPYLNADVPEWLQVYARASPEFDQYLKWDMFRYPELDCWQTMLKRLYKKELEQIVLWFEEYRQALSKELKSRRRSFGMLASKRPPNKVMETRVRKTDV